MTAFRTLRMMLKGVLKSPSADQVALGIALGVAVGLVPKGNLFAFGLGFVMCALRLNLPVAIATAVLVSVLSPLADLAFDLIGGSVLTLSFLRPIWESIARLPFSEWTQFNNTVVLGSFLVAIAQIYPTYRLARPHCERLLPRLEERLQKSRVMRWWSRLEWSDRLTTAARS